MDTTNIEDLLRGQSSQDANSGLSDKREIGKMSYTPYVEDEQQQQPAQQPPAQPQPPMQQPPPLMYQQQPPQQQMMSTEYYQQPPLQQYPQPAPQPPPPTTTTTMKHIDNQMKHAIVVGIITAAVLSQPVQAKLSSVLPQMFHQMGGKLTMLGVIVVSLCVSGGYLLYEKYVDMR